MMDGPLYFIQQTEQQGQSVVVAGRIEQHLPDGALLISYRLDDGWAESMNVIMPYERPNLRYWHDLIPWEQEWGKLRAKGEKLVAAES